MNDYAPSPTMTISRRLIAASVFGLCLISAVGCAATRTTESTGEYFDDTAITTSVKAALLAEADIKSFDINVETFRGDVQLSGFVNSQNQIERAIAVARQQKGVKSVKNDLRIKTS
nr:BON domain-containing protein [Nevskia sp.]